MRRPVLLSTFAFLVCAAAAIARQAPALRIVVLEGEGAVNIIQQKSAVRPLVEVRDRNHVPVAGASVTFTIGGGGQGAVFTGGAQTLTVTTNAAGRAAASGFSAVSSGAVQIQVQAVYQGQIATAAISQTNFATAAAAAQAGAAGGGGAAGGTAGAGGGGVSATTLGIVGAAVGGGALVATQTVLKKPDEPVVNTYDGPLSGQLVLISRASVSSCTRTHTVSGGLTIDLFEGNATGGAGTSPELRLTETAAAGCIPSSRPITLTFNQDDVPVTGGPSALTFNARVPVQNVVYTVTFTGSLSGNTINGTIGIDVVSQSSSDPELPNLSGSTSFPITLTGPRS